jgi:biotin synthase
VKKEKLLDEESVLLSARRAQTAGATRFCMGAAWRSPKDGPEFDHVLKLVKGVKELGLEVCCTLGLLTQSQAARLKEAGLYAYNHNIDTSPAHYEKVIQTRNFEDRLRTIENVRNAGLTVCTGGILGLGETHDDRQAFILQLATLEPQPESLTINTLVPFAGTPLAESGPVSAFDVVRVVATLRILCPQSMIRLSAGRMEMSDEAQFLCFYAGANSVFLGEKLLTSPNPEIAADQGLFRECGIALQKSAALV